MPWPIGFTGALAILGAMTCCEAQAEQSFYSYEIVHPTYGNIGTFTEAVDDHGKNERRFSYHVSVAVKIAGIVVYREDAENLEDWRDGTLVSLNSVTEADGKHIEVRGRSMPECFEVVSPSGLTKAPSQIGSTNPWALTGSGKHAVVSTKTGEIENIVITGGKPERINIKDREIMARHFRIDTDAQPDQFDVWLDSNSIPLKFRSLEGSHGSVDFILTSISKDLPLP